MSLGTRPSRRALSSLYSALEYTDQLRLSEPDLGYATIQSTAPGNSDANRYRDILAYDHALLPGAYLNAAYIPPFHPTSSSFIVSQAPLPETFGAFYTHMVEQRVRVLVNLTPLVEKGRLKAHPYWPMSADGQAEHARQLVLDDGRRVTCESEHKIALQQTHTTLVRRVLHIDSGSTSSQGTRAGWRVTQFHLTSWPDHGVFPTSLLLQLMHEIQAVTLSKDDAAPPMWIHCSAGVGRSGTLAAALIAKAAIHVASHTATEHAPDDAQPTSQIQHNTAAQLWDLPVRIVEHLRRYRARMVQTLDQFEAVYEIVAELASEAGLVHE